jgi:drug/metabolite transporter (DMT)-like permease
MSGDKSNPFSYAIIFHFLIAILNLVFALIHGFKMPLLNDNLPFFLLAGALWGGTTILLFKALQLLESSEVTILISVRVLITIIASITFLQESFNLQKLFGTIIILTSILLVTNLKQGIRFNKGVMYAFGVALFSGLAIVVDSFNLRSYEAVSYNTTMNFLIGFILLAIYPKALLQWKHFIQRKFLKKMLPLGLFSSIHGIAPWHWLMVMPLRLAQ